MLNEAEQRQLAEIEAGLRADDPEWAQRLHGAAIRPRRHRSGIVAALFLVTAAMPVSVGFLAGDVVAGSFITVVVVLVSACVLGMWATERRDR